SDLSVNLPNGLEVGGTQVEKGQSASFSVTIFNEVGGTAQFDGFTSATLSQWSGQDQALISNPDVQFLASSHASSILAFATRPSFTLANNFTGSGNSSRFRIDFVGGTFSEAPPSSNVPEPTTSMLLLSGIGCSLLFPRRSRLARR
ncbi:MAG: PEP-CTERM sorting domain-containing protein, partial [Planctomycetales bacterium]|nr:PEP-CTERM sorting domain-containing protein [Planctomycetales bacterium]